METCDEAGNFLEPVNYKELGLLDYPLIIKHPMDLSTCKKKLVHGKYYNIEKLNKDLSQIWENCRIYNQSGSLIVQQADTMEEHHKKYLADNPLSISIPVKRQRDEGEEESMLETRMQMAEKLKKSGHETLKKIFSFLKQNSRQALEKVADYYRIKIDKLEKSVFEQVMG